MSDLEPDASARVFWDEVETVFSAALEGSEAERRAIVDARCAGRPAVRAEVESLLAIHGRAGHFMQHPTMAADSAIDAELHAGDVVGQFRLVERIAEGGMGIVYRAVRADNAFEQQVAVKIIAAPIANEEVKRRFLAERQILASLHHPHIVGLLDAGLTESGRAYLIMEFVDGSPITNYCCERRLSIADRLRLLRQVCDAVQYAHAHFVVHSDLKPANILVTAEGVPKVLDFGIATLLQAPAVPVPSSAARGSAPLTPNYASPEQLYGADVTIASDVFGLGMLMFELLTDTRPYDVAGKPLDEVRRIVAETPTRRPSEAAPERDVVSSADWRRARRGDLDAIAVRACHRAPEQRYASADALAQDLARYLSGLPVEARKPTLPYIAGKLAARHRVAFASIALSGVLVVAALAIAVWQARVATVERQRADRRFNEVRQLANTVIFNVHDAVAPLPGSTPVRQTIVTEGLKYLERLTAESSKDRQLQLELGRAYVKIGSVQGRPNTPNLGDREGAIQSFQRAKSLLAPLATAVDAPADVFGSYLDSIRFLSETLGVMGASHRPQARAEAHEAMRAAESFAATHPALEQARSFIAAAAFAVAIRTPWPESLTYWQKAGAEYDALLAAAPEDPTRQRNAALVQKYLGGFFENTDIARALVHHRRALDLDQQRFDRAPDDRVVQFDLAIDLSNAGYMHWQHKELAQAIALYRRSLEMRERLLSTDPKDSLSREKVAFIHRQLGALYRDKGDTTEALSHYRQAVDGFRRTTSITSRGQGDLADSWAEVGALEAASGHISASCQAYRRALALYQAIPAASRSHGRDGLPGMSDPLPATAQSAARCGQVDAGQ